MVFVLAYAVGTTRTVASFNFALDQLDDLYALEKEE